MRRIGLLIEYDGTAYHGSQRQARDDTIEGRVRDAALALTGRPARVVSQGRTDAGAHARGQVMALDTEAAHQAAAFVGGLNCYLPHDIAVRAARELAPGFDVRRRARSRQYRYLVRVSSGRSPLWRRFAWVCEIEPDVEAMQAAAGRLVGERDFAAFAGRPDRPANTVRRMLRATVKRKGGVIGFTFEATAFLPHQVRRTVGALMQVGQGKMNEETFRNFLRGGAFAQAGPVAPPQGLCLWSVSYEPPVFEGSV